MPSVVATQATPPDTRTQSGARSSVILSAEASDAIDGSETGPTVALAARVTADGETAGEPGLLVAAPPQLASRTHVIERLMAQ